MFLISEFSSCLILVLNTGVRFRDLGMKTSTPERWQDSNKERIFLTSVNAKLLNATLQSQPHDFSFITDCAAQMRSVRWKPELHPP